MPGWSKRSRRLLFAALLASTPLSALAGPPPSNMATVHDFIRASEFSQLTISPDGKYLAALVPMPGKPYENVLTVLDAQTTKRISAVPSGTNQLIESYFWASNDRLVGSMAFKRGGLDTPQPTGELYAINADGSKQAFLFGPQSSQTGTHIKQAGGRLAWAEPISEQPVGDDRILIATNDYTRDRNGPLTQVEKLNIFSGQSTRVGIAPTHNATLLADHQGVVRAAYSTNDFTDTQLWVRNDDRAAWVLLNDPAKTHQTLTPLGFNRDDSQLYVRSSQGDGPDAIERLDLRSGARHKLYQGRFADPGELLPTADHRDYYAVITNDGQRGLFYLDEDSKEAHLSKALAANFPGELAVFSSFTRDGSRAIVHVSSDRNPGDFYVFDLESHNARYLVSARRWLDPNQLRPMLPIALKARDGLDLHGYLTLPSGPKPYPLVVLPHGGPYGLADQWAFDPETQMLAAHGYAVLQLNYRGSGGYGQNFIARGYRQWGLSMQDDLTDATHWAVQQGYASDGNICIYGGSYGGYAALEGAVREPDLYKCAVGYAGVYDLRVQLDSSDTQYSYAGRGYLARAVGSDRNDLLAHSPLGGVAKIKANLFLAHGGMDPRVPFQNFREFTAALDRQHTTYQTLVEPDEGHGFYTEAHRQALYEKLIGFLDANLSKNETASAAKTIPTAP